MSDLAAEIEPHIPALRRYAWALVRNQDAADDLVQDCLERAIRNWHLRRRDGDPRALLFTILRNLYISTLRQKARRGAHVGVQDAEEQPTADPDAERSLMGRDALQALGALPEEQRSLLLLIAVEDLTYQQAAEVFSVPIGTIMSRLSRARASLRALIDSGVRVPLRRVK